MICFVFWYLGDWKLFGFFYLGYSCFGFDFNYFDLVRIFFGNINLVEEGLEWYGGDSWNVFFYFD